MNRQPLPPRQSAARKYTPVIFLRVDTIEYLIQRKPTYLRSGQTPNTTPSPKVGDQYSG